jgi:hypothetical protein
MLLAESINAATQDARKIAILDLFQAATICDADFR